jgi:hypothetical protein
MVFNVYQTISQPFLKRFSISLSPNQRTLKDEADGLKNLNIGPAV